MTTVTFEEKNNGWDSFYSFNPDCMTHIDSGFFTFRNGQLYEHGTNTDKRNFYGTKHKASITTIINNNSQFDKIFKTLELESTQPLKVTVKTNITNGTLKASEFKLKESRWFAYLRKNENNDDFSGGGLTGIGQSIGTENNTLKFTEVPWGLNIGDTLYQTQNNIQIKIGVIKDYTKDTITIESLQNNPNNNYSFAKKTARIEGGEQRGYYLEIELSYNGGETLELFGITSNAVESFVK